MPEPPLREFGEEACGQVGFSWVEINKIDILVPKALKDQLNIMNVSDQNIISGEQALISKIT